MRACVTGELTFGESFGAIAAGKTHFWIAVLQDGAAALSLPGLINRTPLAYLIAPFVLPRDAFANRRKHHAYAVELVKRRLKRHTTATAAATTDQEKYDGNDDENSSSSYGHRNDHDIFSGLLSDPTMSEDVLLSHAYSLVIAGADTVSLTLTAALHFLLSTASTTTTESSPGAAAKRGVCLRALQSEVRALPYAQLTDAVVSQLPYLNAVIEEALRLFPPVPFGLPRVVPLSNVDGNEEGHGEGGATATATAPATKMMMLIDGHAVPGGTEVSVPHWVMNRRADVWGPRSGEFVPERWLPVPVGWGGSGSGSS